MLVDGWSKEGTCVARQCWPVGGKRCFEHNPVQQQQQPEAGLELRQVFAAARQPGQAEGVVEGGLRAGLLCKLQAGSHDSHAEMGGLRWGSVGGGEQGW
jgi:hypothetical protein